MTKRFCAVLLAAAVAAGPAWAQGAPGDPAGGAVPYAATPGNLPSAAAPRHHRHRAHHRRHHRHAARPAATDAAGVGLDGSAPSR